MTDDADLTLVPLSKLVEEVQRRCLGMVLGMEVALDGDPHQTQLVICTNGNMATRFGLASTIMMRVQKDVSEEMEEDEYEPDDHEDL